MNVLILRLTAPMQSWGLQSRFSVRDTAREPTKSGVVGLLGAALGRPRDADFSDLNALLMAVRIDRPGTVRRDYHTAGGGTVPNRKVYGVAESSADINKPVIASKLRTVLSNRYYLADADFRVALAGDENFLQELERWLHQPHWPLFLGRKAFVPNQPLCRGVIEATDLRDALIREPWFYRSPRERKSFEESPRCRAVFELPAARIRESDDVRPDIVDTFASRDFQLRHVQTDWLTIEPHLIQEDQSCFCPR
jgi:CRISPR system Cascade subunit CasD